MGAQPIDELKDNVDLALSAECAEKQGELTTSLLASYLAEHPYSSTSEPNTDRARKYLDKLTDMGIVKKRKVEGQKANRYNYAEDGRSWRQSGE